MVALNDQQEEARKNAVTWYRAFQSKMPVRPWYEISGPAGSGKTTLVKYIIESLDLHPEEVVFVAFTGKAALALRLSGVPGKTIHSLCYRQEIINARDEKGNIIYVHGMPKLKRIQKKVDCIDPRIRLIVGDESGMIEAGMGMDLMSFGVPLIALGDLHQLPPVFGNGIFLRNPDSILTKVMRQAEGNPIIELSQHAIYRMPIAYGDYGKAKVIRKEEFLNNHEIAMRWLSWSNMTICGTNQMRDLLNKYVRSRIQGIHGDRVQVGDKLICRQNSWNILLDQPYDDIALVNGLVGTCTEVYKDTKYRGAYADIDFKPEFTDGQQFNRISINHPYLFAPYKIRKEMNILDKNVIPFEFGNAITCHLAQGSQAKKVLLFVENWSDSDYFWRWLYTGITRASDELVIVM